MFGEKKASIYTDGSCLGNPGPGGWGAVILIDGSKQSLSGGDYYTTNNRMEMSAVINALDSLPGDGFKIDLFSDSQYVINPFNKNWIRKWKRDGWTRGGEELKNSDLWQILYQAASRHEITWHWVKGHAGNHFNELCDQMAVAKSKEYENFGPPPEENPFLPREQELEQMTLDERIPTIYVEDDESVVASGICNDGIIDEPASPQEMAVPDEIAALDTFMQNTHKVQDGMNRPCGLYEYCDYCSDATATPCPCAIAYLNFYRHKGEFDNG